ncbi:MAG: DUF89 family protein [Chloroflexi bacterium]|nr:DUF89 family protein [Chloroflexota bacterium]
MKVTQECYPCLGRLIHQAAELATEDALKRAEAIEQASRLLESSFSLEKTSIAVATPLHRIVRAVTGNPDPYFKMKEAEVAMALALGPNFGTRGSLRAEIMLAVRGNTIDFFREIDEIKTDLASPVEFAIDHVDLLEARLPEAKRILYLADNTGEVFFDLRLIWRFSRFGEVTYVVKESPVQNDVTIADIEHFGFARYLSRVISTGTDTPGVDMDSASEEFKAEFAAADLILAKGMGYWETLSELPPQGKVFHLLKAKCGPVADSVGVPLNSYVAMLR